MQRRPGRRRLLSEYVCNSKQGDTELYVNFRLMIILQEESDSEERRGDGGDASVVGPPARHVAPHISCIIPLEMCRLHASLSVTETTSGCRHHQYFTIKGDCISLSLYYISVL